MDRLINILKEIYLRGKFPTTFSGCLLYLCSIESEPTSKDLTRILRGITDVLKSEERVLPLDIHRLGFFTVYSSDAFVISKDFNSEAFSVFIDFVSEYLKISHSEDIINLKFAIVCSIEQLVHVSKLRGFSPNVDDTFERVITTLLKGNMRKFEKSCSSKRLLPTGIYDSLKASQMSTTFLEEGLSDRGRKYILTRH